MNPVVLRVAKIRCVCCICRYFVVRSKCVSSALVIISMVDGSRVVIVILFLCIYMIVWCDVLLEGFVRLNFCSICFCRCICWDEFCVRC